MNKYLISINDLPPGGKEFELDDQEIWLQPLREFKMDCRITTPLKTTVFVQAADSGCVVRGHLTGAVTVPCSRCTEDAAVAIDSHFDEYEEIPENSSATHADSSEGHIVFDRNAPMLNLAEVAWEQFMLALPPRPLCREDCRGLCPHCGINLNMGECECKTEDSDPRLSALRNITINKK